MAYNTKLSDKLRESLAKFPDLKIEEKEMFSGLAFIINNKMCINVSGENLMCRFDPEMDDEVAEKKGYEPMIMKGKKLAGYCYVTPVGFALKKDFDFWVNLCLVFNPKAKSSKKKMKLMAVLCIKRKRMKKSLICSFAVEIACFIAFQPIAFHRQRCSVFPPVFFHSLLPLNCQKVQSILF